MTIDLEYINTTNTVLDLLRKYKIRHRLWVVTEYQQVPLTKQRAISFLNPDIPPRFLPNSNHQRPCSRYFSSVAALAGSHQSRCVRYHSISVSGSKAKFAGSCSSEQTGYNVLR